MANATEPHLRHYRGGVGGDSLTYGGNASDEYGAESRVRIRAYKFGDHLRQQAGLGVLTLVSTSALDINIVKAAVLRALYGARVALELVDWCTVQLFLLPDGEEITASGEWGPREVGTCFRFAYAVAPLHSFFQPSQP